MYLRVVLYQEGISGINQVPANVPQSHSVPGGNQGQQPGSFPNMSAAQQWLGPQSANGTLAMLADGMAQLQAAMIKQLDKGAEGERSPEPVKPGTTALPQLKEVVAETACVDVMDWLEMIDGPMSDLSDSSAVWWRAVMRPTGHMLVDTGGTSGQAVDSARPYKSRDWQVFSFEQ